MAEGRFPRANRVRQLEHALSVLDLFSPPERTELSLSEVAEELGLSEEYAFKLLRHLEAAGVVERGPVSGGWRLGIRLATLGGYAIRSLNPWDEFRPPLTALQEATGLGGLIAVLSGGRAVYVDHFRGPERALGRAFPAHATALGKAILAGLTDAERQAALAELVLDAWTAHTITDPTRLTEDLDVARERGYAIEDAEFHLARRSIGAAVRDHSGRVVAAVGVGAPVSRIADEAIAEIAAAVVEAAQAVSARLGAGALEHLPAWQPVVEVQAVLEPPLEVQPAGATDTATTKPARRRPRAKKGTAR
ncbi:MAG: IclR family transcriptional regulator [Thermoleophilia bacterium]